MPHLSNDSDQEPEQPGQPAHSNPECPDLGHLFPAHSNQEYSGQAAWS